MIGFVHPCQKYEQLIFRLIFFLSLHWNGPPGWLFFYLVLKLLHPDVPVRCPAFPARCSTLGFAVWSKDPGPTGSQCSCSIWSGSNSIPFMWNEEVSEWGEKKKRLVFEKKKDRTVLAAINLKPNLKSFSLSSLLDRNLWLDDK